MSPLELVLGGTSVIAASGLCALLLGLAKAPPRLAALIATAGAVVGGSIGLYGAVAALHSGRHGAAAAAWHVPGGALQLGIDPLSAFFLAPLFALGALAAVYGRGYLGARARPAAQLDLLLAAMALVLVARHALLFLVGWEGMTLLAYLLVTLDRHEPEVRRAGWVYLIASHVALILLVALFLTLATRTGGALDFAGFAAAWGAPAAGGGAVILLLALGGFGIKAGVVGVHAWLPEAHAAAPSHVSALMSGVLIKLGLYGLLRTALWVEPAAWFGVTLMAAGALGALAGIALALYQRDLKRVLAYSSVENVGIILLALGLGLWARAHGDARLAAIALGGGLLHVWNHATMKGLMFMGAGSVLHGAGTRDLERLGGLLRRMPWTGRALLVGAIAIAALPPLAGFTGEWLLYRGLAEVGLRGAGLPALAAIGAAALLALVGGLAALCFVRVVGVALLGAPRSDGAAHAHESPPSMTLPAVALAVACLAVLPAAPALVSLQGSLLGQLGAGAADVDAAAALLWPLVAAGSALLAAILLGGALLAWRLGRREAADTWGCGYAAPTPRMQYTGHAFSELFAGHLLPRWLRARLRVSPPRGPFPASAAFASDTADPVTRAAYEPLLARWADRFARLRFLQQGNVHVYILYIVGTAIVGLAWVAWREWWGAR